VVSVKRGTNILDALTERDEEKGGKRGRGSFPILYSTCINALFTQNILNLACLFSVYATSVQKYVRPTTTLSYLIFSSVLTLYWS